MENGKDSDMTKIIDNNNNNIRKKTNHKNGFHQIKENGIIPNEEDERSITTRIRESCFAVMEHMPIENNDNNANTNKNNNNGVPMVSINEEAIHKLAENILKSMKSNGSTDSGGGGGGGDVEWDEHEWHYNAKCYERKWMKKEYEEKMKKERISLYLLALDSINFCFWPTKQMEEDNGSCCCCDDEGNEGNLLEYHHLALILKAVAELDDHPHHHNNTNNNNNSQEEEDGNLIVAESSFAFSPVSLSQMTPSKLQDWVNTYLPQFIPLHQNQLHCYHLSNITQRAHLLREVGIQLINSPLYHGSLTSIIRSSSKSAVQLVHTIQSLFPGFRDHATLTISSNNNNNTNTTTHLPVYFYKRAQIFVADLWGAFGRQSTNHQQLPTNNNNNNNNNNNIYQFHDINQLTTFPDYRVPQFLRHVGVLQYSLSLATLIDSKHSLKSKSSQEIYIRAATVVAVEQLVQCVQTILMSSSSQDDNDNGTFNISAVSLDWYLWQMGERMDQLGQLGEHHRVISTFY